MRILPRPAGIVEVADLAGAVVQIVVVHRALVEAGEIVGRESAVENHEAGVQAQGEGDGVLVLPRRFGLLDNGTALELRESVVRDGIAEGGLVVLLIQGRCVPVSIMDRVLDLLQKAVHVTVDGIDEQGRSLRRMAEETLRDKGVVGLLGQRHLGVELRLQRPDEGIICQFQVHSYAVD